MAGWEEPGLAGWEALCRPRVELAPFPPGHLAFRSPAPLQLHIWSHKRLPALPSYQKCQVTVLSPTSCGHAGHHLSLLWLFWWCDVNLEVEPPKLHW